MLTFQEGGDRVCGKGLAHIFNDKLHYTVKKILLVDAVTLHNIAGDHGVVDAVDDLIGVLCVIFTQRYYGEAAKADISSSNSFRDNVLSALKSRYSRKDRV